VSQESPILINASGKGTEALRKAAHGPQALGFLFLIAMATRATDIHIEPKKDDFTVRMRVDGRMVWVCDLPRKVGDLVGGMVKAACEMGQAARDAIQEGHFSARFEDRRVEFRVSFTPSLNGQKLVIRVLDQMSAPSSLSELGLLEYMQRPVQRVCRQDHGLLLVSGPTGSGKTTTLYNCLREIDREARNVITIEDPVEYQIDGVTQMPVNEMRGNSFGSMLRSVLRQDPDVILLGEVRDEDTARTAMQAAMTGHVVFSTIHAKDTITSIFRLLDLKVEPYLVANSLDVVLAQRLVRVVCPMCVRETRLTPGQSSRCGRFLKGRDEVPIAVGCRSCLRTGYQGRRAVFEMVEMTDELR
ncbi:MAG: type II/IV secretion system protein, partial [Phycisphaerales bacterium]|nr:type II/IV secretion system protein [Phycisphaerales bacterium]